MNDNVLLKRSFQEWLTTLPISIILVALVLFSTSSAFNAQLSKLAVKIWPDYYSIVNQQAKPDCALDIDIEKEINARLAAANAEDDDLAGFFDDAPKMTRDTARASVESQLNACQEKHTAYDFKQQQRTPAIMAFNSVKENLSDASRFTSTWGRVILLILLFLAAATASRREHHIALRPIESKQDLIAASLTQLLSAGLLLFSAFKFYGVLSNSGVAVTLENNIIRHLYLIGFGILFIVNAYKLLRGITGTDRPNGGFLRSLLAVPLYAYMAIISGFVFFTEGSPTNMIIYFNKMLDFSSVFTTLGLFIWVGMILKQTRLAGLVFDSLSVWKFPPEILAFIIILISALPTAYTGGSAIYVIAAGAVIFNELRRAGTRPQLALATTAMSGSMGIVLNPCLMLVLIAAMNKEVTSSGIGGVGIFDFDQMDKWGLHTAGFWVLMGSALLFLILSLVISRPKLQFTPVSTALPKMGKLLKPVVPYVLIIAVVLLIYRFGLNTHMNETWAPIILPAVMLFVLWYDQRHRRKHENQTGKIFNNFVLSLRGATKETSYHIGALLTLMAMSICLGGVADGMTGTQLTDSGNIWITMLTLVVILVAIGMFMDPMGAIILVSMTFADFAYSTGIHPLHFWMVTLVAFELGYLTPPVALNHLMTRQVVGEEAFKQAALEEANNSFYRRHERILLPIIVMASSLVVVAFVPLMFYADKI